MGATATSCYGYGGGSGSHALQATIAVSRIVIDGAVSITYKYDMPRASAGRANTFPLPAT